MSNTDTRAIAIIATGLVAVLVGGGWWFMRREAPTNSTPAAVTATEAPIDKPAPPAVNLPPLDQMDAFLRPLLSALSARPELARWLATDDLIGQLAFAIDRAGDGDTPSRDFKVVAPVAPFAVSGRSGTRRTIDPRSHRRYDGLVTTVTSMDAAKVVEIYRTIRPRLNEAYHRQGHPGGDVDRAVSKALEVLLDTPIFKDPVVVIEGPGVLWEYADPALEALEPSQKQLLRMGSNNVERLQTWLRALQMAIQSAR
jgi:hypothetical protein